MAQEKDSVKKKENHHEFRFSLGDPIIQSRKVLYENMVTLPVMSLSYRFRALKWLWIGSDLSYCASISKGLYSDAHQVLLALSVRFSYLNREKVVLYSEVSSSLIGYTTGFHTSVFIPQLTAFGVSVGGQNWFGSVELGVGYKGIFNLGFGYRCLFKYRWTEIQSNTDWCIC